MSDLSIEQRPSDENYTAHALARVRDALTGLRYGEVTVIVQDGVIVQVERTEKLRLKKTGC
ncbi:MAG: YezD family protein [Deltaproteobacteria bacterium]|nr:YezD family protein [Deltaproteobacteria bacterium]MBI3389236.1 YezD family protein [Deltaproteobacteria bacterium]